MGCEQVPPSSSSENNSSSSSAQYVYVAQTPEGPQYFIPQVPPPVESAPYSPSVNNNDYYVHIDMAPMPQSDRALMLLRRSLFTLNLTLILALLYNLFGFFFFPTAWMNILLLVSLIVGVIGASTRSKVMLMLYALCSFFFAGFFTYFFIMFFIFFVPSFLMWWSGFAALRAVRAINYHSLVVATETLHV